MPLNWFDRWLVGLGKLQREVNEHDKIAGMNVTNYSGDMPKPRYPVSESQEGQATRGGIEDDFTMAKLVYQAVKAIPEKRRGDLMEFVIKRIEHERRETENAR